MPAAHDDATRRDQRVDNVRASFMSPPVYLTNSFFTVAVPPGECTRSRPR